MGTISKPRWEDHKSLVRYIAQHISKKLPKNAESFDDLVQVGYMGLLEAIEKYDPHSDATFATYASFRIKGFILDHLRANDHLPRNTRKNLSIISDAREKATKKLQRLPTTAEIADEIEKINPDLGLEFRRNGYVEELLSSPMYLEEIATSSSSWDAFFLSDQLEISTPLQNPETYLEKKEQYRNLNSVIENLSHREKLVIDLYHEEGLTLLQIGERLRVSESRVCQIYAQTINKIRKRINAQGFKQKSSCHICIIIEAGICTESEAVAFLSDSADFDTCNKHSDVQTERGEESDLRDEYSVEDYFEDET